MVNQTKPDPLDEKILGKPLREWDAAWEPLPGGFSQQHPELRPYVGLARAMLKGETMYILRGTEHLNGGIAKSLQRIRGKKQTGNSGHGARMIRDNIDLLELEVLLVGKGYKFVEATKLLKTKLINYHDPEWNRPSRRRMNNLRAGKSC